MSMIGNLARISVQQMENLSRNPESVMHLLYPEPEKELRISQGFFRRFFGRKSESKKLAASVQRLGDGDRIDLDKAWHSLHFLFTGQAWEGDFPNGFLVSCGKEVGEVDVGYGPARLFAPAEVSLIANFLEKQEEAKLRSSLNPAAMREAEIYGGTGDEDTLTDEEWEYLAAAFVNARNFIQETVARKMALLVYIN